MKAPLVLAITVTAALGCPASATANPFGPLPYMDHDGTYTVGEDIRPGMYLTLGARGGGDCSWSRLSSLGNHPPDIIDHGSSTEAQYALIATSDVAFETHGCQPWSIGTRPATPIEPIPKTCIYPLTGCVDPYEQ